MVPFRKAGPRLDSADRVLSEANASDWLTCAFGRGDAALQSAKSHDTMAAATLASRQSVMRAQAIASFALTKGQHEGLLARLQSPSRPETSAVIIKRLWDETGLRLQLGRSDLAGIFPETFANDVVEAHGRSESRKRYPGYVVQCMQQIAHIRWGVGPEDAEELIIPGKMIPSTSAASIWNAVMRTVPALDVAKLQELCCNFRIVALYTFPDAHPSNKVVISSLFDQVDRLAGWEGHCASHNLMLVWRDGVRSWDIESPLYCLSKLLVQVGTAPKVRNAALERAKGFKIKVGTPPPDDGGYNDMVLRYTFLRPLLTNSFFTDPDGPRHDPQARHELERKLTADANTIRSGLNAPWYEEAYHCCYSTERGCIRCCQNDEEARSKVMNAVSLLWDSCIDSLKELVPSRWRAVSQCSTKISGPALIHDTLAQALHVTLLSPSELKRFRGEIAAADAAGGLPQVAAAGPADQALAWRILRGKRTLASARFIGDRRTRYRLLALIVGSTPIDKFFGTLFEAEQYSKERSAAQPPVGLLESMVDPNGILHRVHLALAQYVFDAASPYGSLTAMARHMDSDARSACRSLRAFQIRLSASFFVRFLLVFWQKPYDLIRLLDLGLTEQDAMMRRFIGVPRCPKCLGPFALRARARLLEEPELTIDEMRELMVHVLLSITNDPYVVSMHPVELLHADSRQVLYKCMGKRKRKPVSVFSGQVCSRWSVRHRRALGPFFRPMPSVKAKIKQEGSAPAARKTWAGDKRKVCGSNVHFSLGIDAAKEEDGPLFCYRDTQKALHAQWRTMSDDEKKPYHDMAEQGFKTDKRSQRMRKGKGQREKIDYDGQNDKTPWQLGSVSRPCSTKMLRKVVGDLLPDAKHWLRQAYAKAVNITDASSGCCPFVDDSEPFCLRSATKARLAQKTCFQRTPGLCASTPDFAKIKRFRSALTKTVSRFAKDNTCHGELLLAFGCKAGNCRPGTFAHEMMSYRHCKFVFLSGEPDKRKSWKVFSCCQSRGDERIFPFAVRLESRDGTFVEVTDYMLAAELYALHPTASSWNVYLLTYRDDPSRMSEVRVESASAGEPLSGSHVVAATVLQEDAVDEFEVLWQSTCIGTTTTACQKDFHDDDDASTDSSQEAMQDLAPRSSDDERDLTDMEEAAKEALQRREAKKQSRKKRTASQASIPGRASVDNPLFTRTGNNLFWNGSKIGRITAWGSNLSCHCALHSRCKTPALGSAKVSSDRVFTDWLASALNTDGTTAISRDDHQAQAQALRNQHR